MFYVYLPFNEERSEFKKIQPISPHLYWAATFLFDALVHTLVCVLLIALHVVFDLKHHFFGPAEFGEDRSRKSNHIVCAFNTFVFTRFRLAVFNVRILWICLPSGYVYFRADFPVAKRIVRILDVFLLDSL